VVAIPVIALFTILTIEIDGHFHGSAGVPRPWVATILGTDPKYGLRREFVRAMTDWKGAHVAWSGNVYGREARFLLRDGTLYEVCRLRGKSSKRHLVREFVAVDGRKRVALDPEEALARADGLGDCATLRIPEDRSGESWVAHVTGLGTPKRIGYVVDGSHRLYRLQEGIFEVMEQGNRRFVCAHERATTRVDEREAWGWLAT
jgi:hypothetical protein